MTLDRFLLLVVNGLVSGALYGLVAMGFVLVYKTSGVLNFAQGELVLAGAATAAFLTTVLQVPFGLAVLLALLSAVGWGLLIERFVVGPLAHRPLLSILMSTIAIGLIVRNVTLMVTDPSTKAFPPVLPTEPVWILGFPVSPLQLVAAGLAASLALLLSLFLQFSRIGIAMRAVADDPEAAGAMGIPVKTIFGWSWILSAVVAAVGGIALGLLIGVDASLSFVGLKVFPAVIVGGLDSLKGAIVGGLVVGLVENLGGALVNPFVILILILMIRPAGLFGRPTLRRV
jgi:branched-chain amino acid transport system permease protein